MPAMHIEILLLETYTILKNSYLVPICRRVPVKRWTRLYSNTDRSELFDNTWTSPKISQYSISISLFFFFFFDVHLVQTLGLGSVQLPRIPMFSVINKLQNPERDLSLSRLAFSNIFWQFSSNFVNNCAYWLWKLRVYLIKQLAVSWADAKEKKIKTWLSKVKSKI